MLLCIAALLPQAALAQQQPEEFTTRLPIVAESNAPYYRLIVPLEGYLQSARGDLRDLRIFDSAGQSVPHARLAVDGSSQASTQIHKLRWFPFHAESEMPDDGVTSSDASLNVSVRQSGDGTLVEVRRRDQKNGATAPSKPRSIRGYILDASQISDRSSIHGLELDWSEGDSHFHLIDIETSDDLGNWRTLRSNVQLARLEYSGARIENRRIELNGFRDRYLRILWREPARVPKLTLAEIEQTSTRFENAPLLWSAPVTVPRSAGSTHVGEYRFHLPQALPLARLRIDLPAGNVLMPLHVLQPGRQPKQMLPLAGAVVYRIQDKGRQWKLDEIPLANSRVQDFVIRLDPRSSQPDHLTLSYALEPVQVIFLASGTPPYTLAIGNGKANDSALEPSMLIPGLGNPGGLRIARAELKVEAAVRSVAQPGSPAAIPPEAVSQTYGDWKKHVLWGVLIAGVLGLLFMAWQMLRQLDREAKTGK